MNNIYVDELPKDCWNCEFGYQEHSFDGLRCKFNDKYCNQFKTFCPLKPLSDRLAEERNKVVQSFKEKIVDGTSCEILPTGDICITLDKINNVLDQIERGVK